MKELKETLVAKQEKEERAGLEEASKTAEHLAKGWLAYRQKYFGEKGKTDSAQKVTFILM